MEGGHGKDGNLNRGWIYRDRIQRDDAGTSVLDFYTRHYPHSSQETWRRRIEAGQIFVDGHPARPEALLCTDQRLAYHRPPWREAAVPTSFAVLYEDAHLIAVAKPSGLPTIPGGDFLENSLLHLVRRRYSDRPSPLHRLGRGTSGILLFARSQEAKRRLSADFRLGRLRKTYRALVAGHPAEDTFSIDQPIGPVPYSPLGYVHAASPDGRPSRSDCRVVEFRAASTLVEVDIPTGRPHQIRIHLATAGHPLVGDPLYRIGGLPVDPPADGRAPLPGDCGYHLHALRIRFFHPHTGTETTLVCPPPGILRTTPELP